MRKKIKKYISRSLLVLLTVISGLFTTQCRNNDTNKETTFLNFSKSKAEIGLVNNQKWVFNKQGDKWLFDGVYTYTNNKYVRVFVGSDGKLNNQDELNKNGAYFSIQKSDENSFSDLVDNYVTNIEINKNDKNYKSLKLSGKGFTSYLTVENDSEYVERKFIFNIDKQISLTEGEVSFTLKTDISAFYEYGFVLGHANEVTQYSIPYAFPAMMSKLTSRNDGSVVSYVDVVDYYETSEAFKTMRRKEHINGFFEIGVISSEASVEADMSKQFIEKILLSSNNLSYYDLIYSARKTYSTYYTIPLNELHEVNGNMTVSSWIDAAIGAIGDITDSRSRPLGDDSTFGPYGYNNGGSEAFGAMDILKGLTRYAIAINDQELYQDCMDYLTVFITKDSSGKGYIMPLSNYKSIYSDQDVYFFRSQGSDGNFNPLDPSFTDAGDVYGSFKYYSRVINLGELALITNRDDLKQAYLSLMPFILKMRGPNYEQDIQWNFDGTPCNYEYDNGGSMGAEVMWSNVMYIASQIETNSTKSAEYLLHSEKSLKQANTLDFPKSSALRDYPKPESLTYSAKMNIIFYEMTGNQEYLDNALEVVQSVHFYYFASTHPNTYYQTIGYGYADARERWEAFMEMVETLVLGTKILNYTDDPLLLDLYYTLENSALWTLPINGYPDGYLGGHSDWLDALYVPFEQPTAHMGDNTSYDGGGMSYLRHSKELYGAGEIFTGALTYEVFANASNESVTMINLGVATDIKLDRENQTFVAWNISDKTVNTPVFFNNFKEGKYEISLDGVSIGVYSNEQLANGITLNFKSRVKHKVEVKKTNKENAQQSYKDTITAKIVATSSNGTTIKVDGNAAFYQVLTSYDNNFDSNNTTKHTFTSNTFTLYHEDSAYIYVRIIPTNSKGLTTTPINLTINSNDVEIGYLEDFKYQNKNGVEAIPTWKTSSTYYNGTVSLISDSNGFKNYPDGYKPAEGYMAVYKPNYAGYDIDTFVHETSVDITNYPLFDFYPYTKNVDSKFSLIITIGNEEHILLDSVSSFDKYVYRFDLKNITSLSGEQNVKITMKIEGKNRGFAISQLRFVNEVSHKDYSLSDQQFNTDNAVINQNGYLSITHQNIEQLENIYDLGKINLKNYKAVNLILYGTTIEHNRSVYANVDIYKNGQSEPIVSTKQLINYGQNIYISLDDYNIDNTDDIYTLRISFTRRIGNQIVSEIKVKSIMLESDVVERKNNVYREENGGYILNGWSSNWAYISSDGYIYNGNPNVPYGSIYTKNVAVNLDETPIIRFYVSDVIAGTQFTLKVNDNSTFGTDLALNTQSGAAGLYTVNLREKIGRGGVIVLQFDFYVISSNSKNGAKFEYIEFIKGKTVYNNDSGYSFSTIKSNNITINTNHTPYLFVDISNLSYKDEWKMYLEYNGIRYEVKTVYESVYGQMYSRSKIGAFKYDIRDILPDNDTGVYDVKLIIELGGHSGANVQFRSIRLANNNEVPLIKKTTYID